jgi:hypothetical protein
MMDLDVTASMSEGSPADDLPVSLDEVRHRIQVQASLNRMAEYARALEARCDALWGYLQGHEVAHDPVVGILAADYGVVLADAVGGDALPGVD